MAITANKTATISADRIKDAVALLCQQVNYYLPADVFEAFSKAFLTEKSPVGKSVLNQLLENYKLSAAKKRPMCQDTGLTIVFVDLGQDVHIIGGDLEEAINKGIGAGYTDGILRKSVVKDPIFNRNNSGDNTPGVIHVKIVPGNKIKLTVVAKGTGSENMSRLQMLKPSQGIEGIIEFAKETVALSGSNACPPLTVGIGVGGSMEYAAILAKRSLLRPVIPVEELREKAKRNEITALELKILDEVNASGLGPQGLGGINTAVAVHIEAYPTHIAGLPVAVNLNCNAARHMDIVLTEEGIEHMDNFEDYDYSIKNNAEIPKIDYKKMTLPFTPEMIKDIKAGDRLLLTGELLTARDAAHKRLYEAYRKGEDLPINVKGQTIYYVGPCPPKKGEVIGPAGPTTAGRVDKYTPLLLDLGLVAMIGKGDRNQEVIDSIKKNNAMYCVATGGAGFLLAQSIKEASVIAYPDLGPEAIYKLKVEDFPVTVVIDHEGNNYYDVGRKEFRKGN